MEIERKFWMEQVPELTACCHLWVEQNYLSLLPEVRIRRVRDMDTGEISCDLTIKSEGTLAREEIIKELDEAEYQILADMVAAPPVCKDYYKYPLDGHVLEFSVVDPGTADSFSYGEIEFDSLEEARAFQPPEWFGRELTEVVPMKMKEYWLRTRENSQDNR